MSSHRLALVFLATLPLACGESGAADASSASTLQGTVAVDGSSTVFPITEAVAEEFGKLHRQVRVTVGLSGTGGGMKKFAAGELAIAGASRPMKDSELAACQAQGIEFVELPVAFDGLSVVVNPANTWVTSMTVAELKAMWNKDSTAHTWKDLRADWPDRPFRLYAPGQDSGTFDYFTEVVTGAVGNCRADVTFSEDDNVLVSGVAGDEDGIGFFGFAYFEANASRLKLVAVDAGQGAVLPTLENIRTGAYAPLSRPLFIYVAIAEAKRLEIDAFVDYYLGQGRQLAAEVGYVPLPEDLAAAVRQRFDARTPGRADG